MMCKISNIAILALFSVQISAFKLTPMSQSINPSQGTKKAIFHVKNESDGPIAVEISVAKRKMDLNGSEKHPDASGDFMIFPDQLIIKAGEKKAISVTSLLTEIPKIEKAYRIIAEQLPIGLNKSDKRTDIKILLKYVAAFYVLPKDGKPKIKLVTSKAKVVKNKISFKIQNIGSLHEVMNDYHLEISSKSQTLILSGKQLQGLIGENMLAGITRSFTVSVPSTLANNKTFKLRLFKKTK